MLLAAAAAGVQQPNMSARQVFAHIKIDQRAPIMPLPYKCTVPAPDTINVFTDGSWQFPLTLPWVEPVCGGLIGSTG